MDTPVLYIVLPCYNEEEALPITAQRLRELTDDMLEKRLIDPRSRIVMVDDGSRDRTWPVIAALHASDPRFQGIKLAHNAGHQNALWAGMTHAARYCDCVITIDADLQDDINAMYRFLEKFREGMDVVCGVRSSREKDTAFKRGTAQGFYRLMAHMGVETIYNHADYRLLSARALNALLSFGEVNMFLRGMVPMLGFNSATVEYERGTRVAGESKYPFRKMLAFALQGITSMSNKPIGLIMAAGMLCAAIGLLMAIWTLIKVFTGETVRGWASLFMSIWLIGGLNMMALGLVGEYIGKIYLEVKHRPKYILDAVLCDGDE